MEAMEINFTYVTNARNITSLKKWGRREKVDRSNWKVVFSLGAVKLRQKGLRVTVQVVSLGLERVCVINSQSTLHTHTDKYVGLCAYMAGLVHKCVS